MNGGFKYRSYRNCSAIGFDQIKQKGWWMGVEGKVGKISMGVPSLNYPSRIASGALQS